jgi:hypothetical protein
MHDRVDPFKQFCGQLTDVFKHLAVQEGLRQKGRAGQAMAKKSGGETDQFCVF